MRSDEIIKYLSGDVKVPVEKEIFTIWQIVVELSEMDGEKSGRKMIKVSVK